MSTAREARRDANEFAFAQMFYGEGAGTRRKLITATVEAKSQADPTYARAFRDELGKQDMAEHASKARKERRRRDVTETVAKNTKAIVTGKDMTTGIATVMAIGIAAHQTGLDRKAWEKSKELWDKTKQKYRKARPKKANKDNVYNITDVKGR